MCVRFARPFGAGAFYLVYIEYFFSHIGAQLKRYVAMYWRIDRMPCSATVLTYMHGSDTVLSKCCQTVEKRRIGGFPFLHDIPHPLTENFPFHLTRVITCIFTMTAYRVTVYILFFDPSHSMATR